MPYSRVSGCFLEETKFPFAQKPPYQTLQSVQLASVSNLAHEEEKHYKTIIPFFFQKSLSD